MKKILSLLAAASLITSSAATTIACHKKETNSKPAPKKINEKNLEQGLLAAAQPFILADADGYNINYLANTIIGKTKLTDSQYSFDSKDNDLSGIKTVSDFWDKNIYVNGSFADTAKSTNLSIFKNSKENVSEDTQFQLGVASIFIDSVEQNNLAAVFDVFGEQIPSIITPELTEQILKLLSKDNLTNFADTFDLSAFDGLSYKDVIGYSINILANALSSGLEMREGLVVAIPTSDEGTNDKNLETGLKLVSKAIQKLTKGETIDFSNALFLSNIIKFLIITNNYIEQFETYDKYENPTATKLWSAKENNLNIIKKVLDSKFSAKGIEFNPSRFLKTINRYLIPKGNEKDIFQFQKILNILLLNNNGLLKIIRQFLLDTLIKSDFIIDVAIIPLIKGILEQKSIKPTLEVLLPFVSGDLKIAIEEIQKNEEFTKNPLLSIYSGNGMKFISKLIPALESVVGEGSLSDLLNNLKIGEVLSLKEFLESAIGGNSPELPQGILIEDVLNLINSLGKSDAPGNNNKTVLEKALKNPEKLLSILGFDKNTKTFKIDSPLSHLDKILSNKDLLKFLSKLVGIVKDSLERFSNNFNNELINKLKKDKWTLLESKPIYDSNKKLTDFNLIIKYENKEYTLNAKVADGTTSLMGEKFYINYINRK
ncbi:MOLPALP family lipoprotein [Spiroplasma endosymbiont of Panorpa germanica]|uniref:MOLPALP family lipoprotein n=1 Tax=Spiroplasma endosymbiont of Panorpa germanica TaxID=3066314 RepID=UPI0030CE3ED1